MYRIGRQVSGYKLLYSYIHTFVSRLHLSPKNGAMFDTLTDPTQSWIKVAWGYVVRIGPLHAGQKRDVSFSLTSFPSEGDYVDVTLEYSGSAQKFRATGLSRIPTLDAVVSNIRSMVCRVVPQVIDHCAHAR